jgi:hypothetical protein
MMNAKTFYLESPNGAKERSPGREPWVENGAQKRSLLGAPMGRHDSLKKFKMTAWWFAPTLQRQPKPIARSGRHDLAICAYLVCPLSLVLCPLFASRIPLAKGYDKAVWQQTSRVTPRHGQPTTEH